MMKSWLQLAIYKKNVHTYLLKRWQDAHNENQSSTQGVQMRSLCISVFIYIHIR